MICLGDDISLMSGNIVSISEDHLYNYLSHQLQILLDWGIKKYELEIQVKQLTLYSGL